MCFHINTRHLNQLLTDFRGGCNKETAQLADWIEMLGIRHKDLTFERSIRI